MLPKSQRIRTAADFRRIRGRGRQWRTASYLAFMLPTSHHGRFGVIVSAKIGKAVVRKRAARVLRSAYQQTAEQFADHDIVLIARGGIRHKTAPQLADELRRMSRVSR